MPKARHAGLAVAIVLIAAAIITLDNPLAPPKVRVSVGEGIEEGQALPSFSLQDAAGQEVELSGFRGQNLIINAWAAWCPFCVNEMTDLQRAADGHDDVTVLFVHRTKTEPFSAAQAFLDTFASEGQPITDPVLLDPDDRFYSTFFGIGMPVTLFVDTNGIIKFKKIGPMDLDELNDNIEKYFRPGQGLASGSSSSGEGIQTLPDGTKYR